LFVPLWSGLCQILSVENGCLNLRVVAAQVVLVSCGVRRC